MTPTARASARLLLVGILAALALALSISACGGDESATATGADTTAAGSTRRAAAAKAASCQAQLGRFLGAMDGLRRKLEVGLSYEDYVAEVRQVRATYDRLPTGRLQLGCLNEVGVPAERAFNEYIAAANVWGDCLSEAGCGAPSIEGRLQEEWAVASHFLARAQSRGRTS